MFQPDQLVVYHWWGKGVSPGSTYKNNANERQQLTLKRVKYLLRLELTNDLQALLDFNAYDLGTVRTLYSFWKFCGVNLQTRTIEDFAKQGQFNDAYDRALMG